MATELNPETSVENFHQIISNLSVISEEGNNAEPRISISTKFKIPINFTKWLNSYIEFVEIKTIRELVEQIRNSIQEEITSKPEESKEDTPPAIFAFCPSCGFNNEKLFI